MTNELFHNVWSTAPLLQEIQNRTTDSPGAAGFGIESPMLSIKAHTDDMPPATAFCFHTESQPTGLKHISQSSAESVSIVVVVVDSVAVVHIRGQNRTVLSDVGSRTPVQKDLPARCFWR